MNEIVPYKNWFHSNRIWLLSIIVLLVLISFSLPKGFTKGATHMLLGYTDTKLADSAILIANKNIRVKEMLGNIKPMNKMTILEGYVSYSKNLDSVFMALTIKGSKGKGKLDIYAFKNNKEWEYERLMVRLKEPKFRKESIPISFTAD